MLIVTKINENKKKKEKDQIFLSELNYLREEGFRHNLTKIQNVQEYMKERNREILMEKQRLAEEKRYGIN
jgi:hypothetical protein